MTNHDETRRICPKGWTIERKLNRAEFGKVNLVCLELQSSDAPEVGLKIEKDATGAFVIEFKRHVDGHKLTLTGCREYCASMKAAVETACHLLRTDSSKLRYPKDASATA